MTSLHQRSLRVSVFLSGLLQYQLLIAEFTLCMLHCPTCQFLDRHCRFTVFGKSLDRYLEAADRDNQVERAIAAIRWKHRRNRFVESHNLSEPAERPCVARLIGGYDDCPHNLITDDEDPHAPPHSPPIDDHSTLWLNDEKEPAVYSMHIYQSDLEHSIGDGPDNRWFDIIDLALA